MEVTKEGTRFFIETMRRNGAPAAQVYALLSDAWKEDAPSRATVFRLYKDFASGARTSFEDCEHSGRQKVLVCERMSTKWQNLSLATRE